MFYNTKFFVTALKILMVLLIIFLLTTLSPIISPLYYFVKFLVSCLVLAVILFYLFRPLVDFLARHNIPFIIRALTVFLILAIVVIIIVFYIIPTILVPIQQVVTANPEKKAEEVRGFLSAFHLYSYEEIRAIVSEYLIKLQQYIFQNAYPIFSTITHIVVVLAITPFVLFYIMKDRHNFHDWFIEMVPAAYRERASKTLIQLDQILAGFFHGQITIATIVAILAFIGLHLIGMENIPFLTFITFCLTLIPYLGSMLSIIPATFQGLSESYWMALLGFSVMTAVHLTDSNIITPQVMKNRFEIHPMTIVLLLIGSFYFFGILGPLWITPAYVFFRELVIEAFQFFHLDEKS